MKINSIQSHTYTPNFKAENKPAEIKKEGTILTKKNLLVYGLPALGAIGLATFAILKAKKSSAKAVKGILPQTKAQSSYKSNITEVEVKPFSTTPVGSDKSFDGYEKLIYTDNGDGTGHTYQRFYHKDKMYESQVYDDILDNKNGPVKVTRYNYAYDNGKLVGIAKQDIYKDGNSHGGYNKDGVFEPFPIFVKMKGEKEFKDANIYMPEQLFEKDSRFDPFNL